ncbi:ankyrin [Nitritalea halalkaliphila LW7]|uniref:Ankyrin n=1 Tax=Nitritalea halalkaliphila LW7 TaxID=1189621 RepID=I5BR04_9BACT|nr:ankyrin repeat domain-containing protein [Nitritalea halalkaliphila]EIM72006.1 ankyrin [Nitritalea halalkaliphila LW7]
MKAPLMLILSLCLSFMGCGQETNKNVSYFEGTEAYELAKAVEVNDTQKINHLVEGKSELLDVSNPISGSNVLGLSLTIENFEAFKKLLELGADPNFVNPYSKRSILIDACKFYWKPEPYSIDLRYVKLLLKYGANANYTVEEDHTDEKGRSYMATSPLMEASKLDLEMVKLLIKAGADPHKKVKTKSKNSLFIDINGYEI